MKLDNLLIASMDTSGDLKGEDQDAFLDSKRNCGTALVGDWNKNLFLSNELIKVELLPWKI